ncbi:hypothetical protein J6590_098398, partial [Homalodisca vitripennis]
MYGPPVNPCDNVGDDYSSQGLTKLITVSVEDEGRRPPLIGLSRFSPAPSLPLKSIV